MTKDRWMSVRLPADIEKALRQQAQNNTRTLAAQVLHYIKLGLSQESNKAKG